MGECVHCARWQSWTHQNCCRPGQCLSRFLHSRLYSVQRGNTVLLIITDNADQFKMLSLFRNFVAIPTPLSAADGYHIHADKISEELARGTSVILTSNPRNPTGHALHPEELSLIQDICRDRATLIFDEFYSGYRYDKDCDGSSISAASNVIDVDRDDVLLIDGLTKRFRLPGWRVAWIVGPKEFIKALGSCGSYLDGGCNVPFQEAAVSMLEPTKVKKEMIALQTHFKMVRAPPPDTSPQHLLTSTTKRSATTSSVVSTRLASGQVTNSAPNRPSTFGSTSQRSSLPCPRTHPLTSATASPSSTPCLRRRPSSCQAYSLT